MRERSKKPAEQLLSLLATSTTNRHDKPWFLDLVRVRGPRRIYLLIDTARGRVTISPFLKERPALEHAAQISLGRCAPQGLPASVRTLIRRALAGGHHA